MSSLIYRAAETLKEIYSDRGTGAKQDLSVWRPYLLENEYRIMYRATNSRDSPRDQIIPIIVAKEKDESDGKAFAKPVCFYVIWTDRKTGGNRDGQLYRAFPPEGYVALSDVAIYQDNSKLKPGKLVSPDNVDPFFRCVHKSLVVSQELGDLLWTDKGSGGSYDGAVWKIVGSAGFMSGEGSNHRPPSQQWSLSHIPSPLYKRMALFDTCSNSENATQPILRTSKITVGTTVSSKHGDSTKRGISTTIAVKASAGVEGIAEVETSVENKAFMEATTSFGQAESKTTSTEKTFQYHVDPGTTVSMWQMCVSDNKDGSVGLFDLKAEHTRFDVFSDKEGRMMKVDDSQMMKVDGGN